MTAVCAGSFSRRFFILSSCARLEPPRVGIAVRARIVLQSLVLPGWRTNGVYDLELTSASTFECRSARGLASLSSAYTARQVSAVWRAQRGQLRYLVRGTHRFLIRRNVRRNGRRLVAYRRGPSSSLWATRGTGPVGFAKRSQQRHRSIAAPAWLPACSELGRACLVHALPRSERQRHSSRTRLEHGDRCRAWGCGGMAQTAAA